MDESSTRTFGLTCFFQVGEGNLRSEKLHEWGLLKEKIEIKDLSGQSSAPIAGPLTVPLPYGTSTRYPQVAIHRSVDRNVRLRCFEFGSPAERAH